MTRFPKLTLLTAAAAVCSLLHPSDSAAQGVSVYISAPTITTAAGSGLTPVGSETIATETFDGTAFGSITKDTNLPSPYTSTALNNATFTSSGTGTPTVNLNTDKFGGYNQGNYLSIPAGAVVTLDLGSAGYHYVGFDFYAGDANNSFTVYSGSTVLGTYSTAKLITLLPNNSTSTVTAVNNSTYKTKAYYGQGVTGSSPETFTDTNEPFAYINLFAPSNTPITKIVLQQATSAAFETDNFSVLATEPAVPGGDVYAGQVPEPSAWVYAVGGLLALGAVRARRARHARGGR